MPVLLQQGRQAGDVTREFLATSGMITVGTHGTILDVHERNGSIRVDFGIHKGRVWLSKDNLHNLTVNAVDKKRPMRSMPVDEVYKLILQTILVDGEVTSEERDLAGSLLERLGLDRSLHRVYK